MDVIASPWGAAGELNELRCPGCGMDGLHHYKVTIWTRREDDMASRLEVETTEQGELRLGGGLDYAESRNPSCRRHGLAVAFWCEGCNQAHELTIAQHKGHTEINWRRVPLPKGVGI